MMIQWVMKRDGRKLDHQTLETIRFMAVESVREGEAPSAVIASYGFSRTSIYRWLATVSKPGIGVRALASRPAQGQPRRLTARQEQKVFRWINGNDPRQYGLDFGLWSRSVVSDLIERKFGIRLGLTAVGELLAKENWWRETYPAIARQAKADGGEAHVRPRNGLANRLRIRGVKRPRMPSAALVRFAPIRSKRLTTGLSR
jgi:transposase